MVFSPRTLPLVSEGGSYFPGGSTMNRSATLIAVAVIAVCATVFFYAPVIAKPLTQLQDFKANESSMEQEIVSKEQEGLEALKKGDVPRFAGLTANEAVFVDSSGPADKDRVVRNVNGFTLEDYSMSDIRFVQISPNAGLIAYKIAEKGNSHGKEFTAQAYVSSLWTRRDNKWLCLFSQETPAK
jgi:hypothetical protein